MALYRTGPYPILESNSLAYSHRNLFVLPAPLHFARHRQPSNDGKRKHKGVCSSSLHGAASASSMESHEEDLSTFSIYLEEETDHVVRFKMSDFKVLDHVSIGLGGRVNYLHSHGLAHTELRLENVHISPIDRHIKSVVQSGQS